jgi:protocatechuate 3,4-dioxygenase beta subunit
MCPSTAELGYLRGVQIADEQGRVTYNSIFPACYSGRWPHIHFEVYPDQASITNSTAAIATSQVALPQTGLPKITSTRATEKTR